MTINERVHYLRKELLHKTMDDFGAALGVGKSAISMIESGKNNVSDRIIVTICTTFGVNDEWMRTGEGEPFTVLDEDDELAAFMGSLLADEPESFRRRVVKMLSGLKPEQWELLEDIWKEMAGKD